MKCQLSSSSTAKEVTGIFPKQAGKWFLVTGAYSGLGVETVNAFLNAGGNVFCVGRNEKNLTNFVDEKRKEVGDEKRVEGFPCDLADLKSVKTFAEHFLNAHDELHVLVNNAGVMNTEQGETAQGFETQFGVNVIGTYLLTKLLLPAVKKAKGRVVILSSVGHSIHGAANLNLDYIKKYTKDTKDYDGWIAYQQSKLGDLILAKCFHQFEGVECASVHPGFINTNLNRHSSLWQNVTFFFKNFGKMESFKSPEQGAATTVYVSLIDNLENGAYYADCAVKDPHANAKNEQDVKDLWEYCEIATKEFQ